jgi:hypothetical protein
MGFLLQLAKVKGELADLINNPQSLLLEALHTVGYQGDLAKPLVVSESALSQITADSLAKFVQVCISVLYLVEVCLYSWQKCTVQRLFNNLCR